MKSLLGCHWIRTHPDGNDLGHVEKMQYRSVKLFEWHWSDSNACRDLLTVLPTDAYILARDHPMSEQKADMFRDPVGTGQRHANEWADKVHSGRYHLPTDRSFFLGINEPDATSGDRNAIDLYTESILRRLRQHGLRGGAFNFSTGHPRTMDGTPNTEADYSVFERSHQAIVEGHHLAVMHIYGTAALPCVAGHYDRIKSCTWQDVEWVVGECGADEHVIGGGNHDGYLISMNGHIDDYCPWLDNLILGINDSRIHSYQVFTYDFSHPWDSFDVRPIRGALETYSWRHMQTQPTPPDPQPPDPTPPGTIRTGSVTAPAGVNYRSGPGTEYAKLGALAHGSTVLYDREDNGWLHSVEGWVSGEYVGEPAATSPPTSTPTPQPTPAPIPTGGLDPRVLEAILQVESGGRTHGPDGQPIIRFESHIFENRAGDTEYFRHNEAQPWTGQQWRRSAGEPWRDIHTGRQADEYAAFEFAKSLNPKAAYESISVGAPQIMGFNHARIGYPSAQAMFEAFERSAPAQTIGLISYMLSDPALVDAIQRRDWEGIARGYNGAGNIAEAAAKYRAAYQRLGG
jgi:uncharacterized protein YraI